MSNYYKALGARIKNYRERIDLSQDAVAKYLGIKRSSLSQIETGKRKVSAEELSKLANKFNISSDVLLGSQKNIEVVFEESKSKKKQTQPNRINVPQKNLEKFREVLIYILEQVGSKPNVGETVLYKLLYFIDFDFYEKYEEQLIGATYTKNHYGPTPNEFKKIVDEMHGADIERIKSNYYEFPQTKYLPLREPDLSILKAHEKELIDDVLAKLSDKSAADISNYSHGDIPWQTTDDGEIIEYESVFYRTPPYSVRDYGEEDI